MKPKLVQSLTCVVLLMPVLFVAMCQPAKAQEGVPPAVDPAMIEETQPPCWGWIPKDPGPMPFLPNFSIYSPPQVQNRLCIYAWGATGEEMTVRVDIGWTLISYLRLPSACDAKGCFYELGDESWKRWYIITGNQNATHDESSVWETSEVPTPDNMTYWIVREFRPRVFLPLALSQ